MLHQALSKQPDVSRYCVAASQYYKTMLTQFPKVQLRIYEHALLVHVPPLLQQGSLLTGSSFFLEAFNKLWKRYLMYHTNCGGGKKKELPVMDPQVNQSEAGQYRRRANRFNTMDLQALKSLWALTHPYLAARSVDWKGTSGVADSMAAVYSM